MRVATALPKQLDERILPVLLEHRHQVIARCSSATQLMEYAEAENLDWVILTPQLKQLEVQHIEHFDRNAIKLLCLTTGPEDEQHARRLGIYDTINAAALPETMMSILADESPLATAEPAEPAGGHPAGGKAGGGRHLGVHPASGHPTGKARASASEQPSPVEGSEIPPPVRTGFFTRARRKAADDGLPQLNLPSAVLAIWGPAGSPGRTTLATNLALELATVHSVILIDADSYGGSVALRLGIGDESSGLASSCRLAGLGALNSEQVQPLLTQAPGRPGLKVLTGIVNPLRWPELTSAKISSVITWARNEADFVIIDTGFNLEEEPLVGHDSAVPRRNAATLASIAAADRVLAVCSADRVGVTRFIRALAKLTEVTEPERIVPVLNRVAKSTLKFNPRSEYGQVLSRFCGITPQAYLPALPEAFLAAEQQDTALREVGGVDGYLSELRGLMSALT